MIHVFILLTELSYQSRRLYNGKPLLLHLNEYPTSRDRPLPLPVGSRVVPNFKFPHGYLTNDERNNFYRLSLILRFRVISTVNDQVVGYLDKNHKLFAIYKNYLHGQYRVKIDELTKESHLMTGKEMKEFPEFQRYEIST